MIEEKIDIPENIQQICREIAKVAQEQGLDKLSCSFNCYKFSPWGSDIHFQWEMGRHGEDRNEIKISSQFTVFTTVKNYTHDTR